MIEDTHNKLDKYFLEKLTIHGTTPRGVDYNGPEAQATRFTQLCKVIDPQQPFSLVDYGSGYGAIFEFLRQQKVDFVYWGFDRIEQMVEAGRERFGSLPNANFTSDEASLPLADYLVAGSIFNIKLDAPCDAWQDGIVETLHRMEKHCRKGFSFNMLTSYSDADRMAARPDLFFGDPLFFFDYCKRNFSRNVALLHDYELYDFTIVIRK